MIKPAHNRTMAEALNALCLECLAVMDEARLQHHLRGLIGNIPAIPVFATRQTQVHREAIIVSRLIPGNTYS